LFAEPVEQCPRASLLEARGREEANIATANAKKRLRSDRGLWLEINKNKHKNNYYNKQIK